MLLAIDTDLFKHALHSQQSKRVIEWLVLHIEELTFAIDKNKVIFREYKNFLDSFDDEEELPVQFLADVLKNRFSTQTHPLPSICTYDIEQTVNENCNEPIEPILIGMGCYAKKLDYVILLGLEGERKRGLRDETVRKLLCKQLSMRVEFPDTKIKYPALECEPKQDRDIWFEDKCREALREIKGWERSYTKTPRVLEEVVGDIDVYGYSQGNPRQVWIGECQFRRYHEDQAVEVRKAKQLLRKKPAVVEYEASKTGSSVQIHTHIISNAKDLRKDTWQLLSEINGTFFCISLTDNSQNDQHWNIVKIEEFEPYQIEEGNWSGHLINTFQNDDGIWVCMD